MFGWSISNLVAYPVGADSTESVFGPLLSCGLAILVLGTKNHPLIHCGHGIPERRNRQGP